MRIISLVAIATGFFIRNRWERITAKQILRWHNLFCLCTVAAGLRPANSNFRLTSSPDYYGCGNFKILPSYLQPSRVMSPMFSIGERVFIDVHHQFRFLIAGDTAADLSRIFSPAYFPDIGDTIRIGMKFPAAVSTYVTVKVVGETPIGPGYHPVFYDEHSICVFYSSCKLQFSLGAKNLNGNYTSFFLLARVCKMSLNLECFVALSI